MKVSVENRAKAEERRWRRGLLTHDRLREVLAYDAETGCFFWKERQSNVSGNDRGLWRAGSEAGWKTKKGYIVIEIDGVGFSAHRLAWYFVYGVMPTKQVDHINLVKDDNRISNLRLATQSQNQHNTKARRTNKLGVKGVYLKKMHPSGNLKYAAKITKDRQHYHLGYFDTIEEAKEAHRIAAEKLHGDFARAE